MRDDSDDVHANPPAGNLARLRDLRDFKVAEGEPDVRGWPVHASDGHRIGQVHDLLVDTSALKVRYLDVEIDLDLILGSGTPATSLEPPVENPTLAAFSAAGLASMAGMVSGLPPTAMAPLISGTYGVGTPVAEDGTAGEGVGAHGGKHVLIPIGRARLDREDDRAFVDGLTSDKVLELPEYGHGPVSREFEAEVLQRFDRGYVHSPERDFYSHSLYDQDTFYGARRERAGERVSRQEREVPKEATPARDR